MLDRIQWNESDKIIRCQSSQTKFTCEFGRTKKGRGQHFEQAMQCMFGRNWSRRNARDVILQAVEAVTEAIVEDGYAVFPIQVVMTHRPRRRVEAALDREQHAALALVAETEGRSMASVLREATRGHVERRKGNLIEVSFGQPA